MKTTIAIILFISLSGCYFINEDKKEEVVFLLPTYEYIKTDTCIIMSKFDSIGNLILTRQLDFDSTIKGVEKEYINGKLAKWKWYEKGQKYPRIIIYFDSFENYIGFKGTPFIKEFYTVEGYVASQMVNLPLDNYMIGYREFENGTVRKQVAYIPGIGDGFAWVTLKDHKYKPQNKYYLFFYVLNKENEIIDSLELQLHHPDTIPPILR